MKHLPERRIRPTGFTLVELLVVISIIAILAGLLVYLLPGITEKKVRGRVKTELAMLVMALNTYKEKNGFYPPHNPDTNRPAPLYYELTGTRPDPVALNLLGVVDTVNSNNFCQGLKPSAYAPDPGQQSLTNLVVPYKGPNGDYNPWRYVSSNALHNPEGFDLWAEVVVGGKTIVIGNWKE
jgi:prepilin-type N-terminal cleavage/methylation domain-containing protein